MKLHVTLTSPYARAARTALIEHGLQDDIEIVVAKTRMANSPYYELAPSGRVPILELDDGRTLEESETICAYFDAIGHGPALCRAPDLEEWEYGRLHGLARSYLDGISVWGRELRRPEQDQSETIILHEQARAKRLVDCWEREIAHPLMNGDLNTAQMFLYNAFDALMLYGGLDATSDHPKLQSWRARLGERASLAATKPPPGKPKPI